MTRHHLQETLHRLDAEWRRLIEDPRVEHDFASIPHDPDAALWRLLAAQQAGDTLAGRIVLQALLGKLVRFALSDADASLDDYLAAAWERIATYPLTTRRSSVAANLPLETHKAVYREQRGPRPTPPGNPPAAGLPAGPRAVGRPPPPPLDPPRAPPAASILGTAARLGLIDDAALSTLHAVYVDGCSGSDAARRLGTPRGAVRVRCHRAVRTRRAHAAELAAA